MTKVIVVFHDGWWRLAVHSDFRAGSAQRVWRFTGTMRTQTGRCKRVQTVNEGPDRRGWGHTRQGAKGCRRKVVAERARRWCFVSLKARVEASTPERRITQGAMKQVAALEFRIDRGYHAQTQHKGKVDRECWRVDDAAQELGSKPPRPVTSISKLHFTHASCHIRRSLRQTLLCPMLHY